MWPENDRFKEPPYPLKLLTDKILYDYDGPQIFTCYIGLSHLFCLKIGEDESSDVYIASEIEDKVLSGIEGGRLAVKAAFEDDNVLVIKTGAERLVTGSYVCKRQSVPEWIMPDSNLGISAKVSRVPNTITQLEAYFAMSFKGRSIGRASMPFGTFKSLVDKSYDAARKILAPPVLARTRSTTFDFHITRPQFSSLIVALGAPIVNEAKTKRIMQTEDITREQLFHLVDQNKMSFFEDMNELVDMAEKESLKENFASERFYLLENIHQIIPSEDTIIESLELNSNTDEDSEYISIDEKIGNVIYRAHKAASYLPIRVTGPIFLINSASRTFSIFAKHGKEITCALLEDAFGILRNNDLFKPGSIATVTGTIKARTRRDFLTVTGIPSLTAANNSSIFD